MLGCWSTGWPPVIASAHEPSTRRVSDAPGGAGGTNSDRVRRQKRKRMAQWMEGHLKQLSAIADDVDMAFASSKQPKGPFRSHALVQPRDGDMLLVPPWLFHSVPKEWAPASLSTEEDDEVGSGGAAGERGERLVFAFNLLQAATSTDVPP